MSREGESGSVETSLRKKWKDSEVAINANRRTLWKAQKFLESFLGHSVDSMLGSSIFSFEATGPQILR